MLKARPNQTIPNKSMNTSGSTSAASAISAPSVLLSRHAFNLIFSKLQIPRFARDDKSSIGMTHPLKITIPNQVYTSQLPQRFAHPVYQHGQRHGYAEGNSGGLRIVERYFGPGHPQAEQRTQQARDVQERLLQPSLPDDHSERHRSEERCG